MSDSIYKKLINALFQMSGSRAMPNGSLKINIPIEPGNSKITYVAPDNGFIRLRALGHVTALEIDSNNQYGVLTGIDGDVFSNNCLFLPVKKGDIVGLLMRPQTGLEISLDRSCEFCHLMGGGG